jgi:hypothetical protein
VELLRGLEEEGKLLLSPYVLRGLAAIVLAVFAFPLSDVIDRLAAIYRFAAIVATCAAIP